MKTIFKISILLIGVAMLLQSCDPQRNCREPKCMYSDVNTEIEVSLSGNLDSLISIGDTIEMYMKIPKSLATNIETVELGTLKTNCFFTKTNAGGDTLVNGGVWNKFASLNETTINFGTMPNGTKTWDYGTREYRSLFIPTEKGRYVIEVNDGRLEVIASDNREWLINPIFKWDSNTASKVRRNQYLQWMDASLHSEALSFLTKKKCWYCFEVK